VTEKIRRKNFLISEGRLQVAGEQSQLTAEEWLYLYNQVEEDDLVGRQADIFASFEELIRGQNPKLDMDTVAL